MNTQKRRVGVIGGGQLAWMMGGAAQDLGLELIVQTPNATDPAVSVATDTVYGAIANATVTAQLAQRCDVITFENEFVDLDALSQLEQAGVLFRPRLQALSPLLDKYQQRQFLRDCGIPTPDFVALEGDRLTDVQTALPQPLSFPVVLKARRLGYDGQGTHILRTQAELATVLEQLPHTDWLLEAFVPFDCELAIMAARSAEGEIVVYPVVETQQEDQVCRRVFVIPDWPESVTQQAVAIAHTILTQLDVVGIFGIELFLTQHGKVLVNEIAPRTHNSGHYTLDACITSQFEQQLRAVCEMPLGRPDLTCPGAVMVNLLGFETSEKDYAAQRQAMSQIPNAQVYWYGKLQSRSGRKLGHVTVRLQAEADQNLRAEAEAIAKTIEAIWYGAKETR